MTDDHRSALDRALKGVGSLRATDLATQMAGGTAGKIMRESLAATSIASQLGNRPNFAIGAALAELQTRVALPESVFAALRINAGIAGNVSNLGATMSALDLFTSRLATISATLAAERVAIRPELFAALESDSQAR